MEGVHYKHFRLLKNDHGLVCCFAGHDVCLRVWSLRSPMECRMTNRSRAELHRKHVSDCNDRANNASTYTPHLIQSTLCLDLTQARAGCGTALTTHLLRNQCTLLAEFLHRLGGLLLSILLHQHHNMHPLRYRGRLHVPVAATKHEPG